MEALHPSPDLARLLDTCRGEVQSRWITLLRDLPAGHFSSVSDERLQFWTTSALDAITVSLSTGDKQPVIDFAVGMSRAPRLQNFSINEIVEGLLLLGEAVYEPFLRHRADDKPLSDLLRRFDLVLRILISRASRLFAEALTESLAAERDRTAFLLDATGAATESLDISVVMPTVAQSIRSALGYSLCSIYLWEPDSRCFTPCAIAGELDDDSLMTVLTERLDPETNSFAGDALLGREISVFRPAAGCRFGVLSCTDLGITAAAVLPIRLASRLLAFALAIDTGPAPELDSHALVLASAIATSVAPAVDNANRHAQMQRMLNASRKLQQAGEALLEMRDLEDLAGIVCREVETLTKAEGSAVLLGDEGAVSPYVFKHGRALALSDERLQETHDTSPGSFAIPLTVRGHNLGHLVLVGPEAGIEIDDLRLAREFADQIAIAVQHALLHRQHDELVAHAERQRLAHDLHDSMAQAMYGLSMQGEAAARMLESGQVDRAIEVLHELRSTASDALREMRLLIFELRPSILKEKGLVAALEDRLAIVDCRAGLVATLEADSNLQVPPCEAEALYGIAKEALNNVLRHARATHVEIRIENAHDTLVMQIRDDGIGFDPAAASCGGGLGLKGMEERAAEVEGRMTITTAPGEGSTLRVEVPAVSLPVARSPEEVAT